MKFFKSITNTYNKLSNWGKILFFVLLLLIVVIFFKSIKKDVHLEGFQQMDNFVLKTGEGIYDDFYADIYDYLVYNNLKDDYEVGQIINKTKPTSESIILDLGSGTGHHVAELASQGYNVIGLDNSSAMVKKAKENFPNYKFLQGDMTNSMQFNSGSFTHIMCLYFTIYYVKDKAQFFNNCYNWLMPGGYLIVHLVDRELFDPILPPGNPLLMVSPQRYAKQRITQTKITFNDLHYSADFKLDSASNKATFDEKFKFKDSGKVRKNQHVFYMEDVNQIVQMAQNTGFILEGQVDLLQCHYEYQYLYIFTKPN